MSNKKLLLSFLLIMSILALTACSKHGKTAEDDTTSIISSNIPQKVTFTAFGGDGEKLSNVTFEILKNDIIVDSTNTDSLGTATFDLETGKYYYTIVSVPEGYVADDVRYDFEVSTQEIEIEVEIEKVGK